MRRSESIKEISAAKAKAQATIKNAERAAENPGFKRGNQASKYADLAAITDACREALAENGIAYFQTPATSRDDKGIITVTVTTLLSHASGEWIECDLSAPASQATPQAIGSAITYLRRYSLAAMTGVAPEDDDGNAASGVDANAGRPDRTNAPATSDTPNAGRTSSADRAKARVAERNGHAAPATSAERKTDLKRRLSAAGVEPAAMAARLGEILGRPIDKETEIAEADWHEVVNALPKPTKEAA